MSRGKNLAAFMYASEQLEGIDIEKLMICLKRDGSMLTWEGTAIQGANSIIEKLVVGLHICLLHLVATCDEAGPKARG